MGSRKKPEKAPERGAQKPPERNRPPRSSEPAISPEESRRRRREAEEREKKEAAEARVFSEAFLDVPDVTPLKLKEAQSHLIQAKSWIERNVSAELRTKYRIEAHPPHWYLPIMIKESRLDAGAPGGYFQINGAAAVEVQEKMKVRLDPQKPRENVICGILYYHLCRFHYAEQPEFAGLSERDRELAASAIYNAGYGNISGLWKELSPSSFDDFAKKLSKHIARSESVQTRYDISYAVSYTEVGLVTQYLEQTLHAPYNAITIGTAKMRREKPAILLRYALIIEALRAKGAAGTGRWKSPEALLRQSENLAAFVLRRERYDPKENSMWRMAQRLADEAETAPTPFFKSYFEENDVDMETIEVFTDAIIAMNRSGNPQLKDLNDDATNIPSGVDIDVLIPNQEYVERVFKLAGLREKDLEERRERVKLPDIIPGPPGSYASPDLEKRAGEVLKSEGKPTLNIPPGKKLYSPNRPNTPKYIILHSTQSETSDIVIDRHNAHFAVDPDGKIWHVVDTDKSIDHVGSLNNPRRKALWNGEEALSRRSIGIEVVANMQRPHWTDAQYKSVRKLVHYYSAQYKIPVQKVVTHQQVACGADKHGRLYRGRKPDPFFVAWEKLGLPNNYLLYDKEVVSGTVAPNIQRIEAEQAGKIAGKGGDESGWKGKPDAALAGLEISIAKRTELLKKR